MNGMENDKKSPEEIITILHSIRCVKIDCNELEAYFEESTIPETIPSFIPGSFTRELLELIDKHIIR
jgi:hypothetical protein